MDFKTIIGLVLGLAAIFVFVVVIKIVFNNKSRKTKGKTSGKNSPVIGGDAPGSHFGDTGKEDES